MSGKQRGRRRAVRPWAGLLSMAAVVLGDERSSPLARGVERRPPPWPSALGHIAETRGRTRGQGQTIALLCEGIDLSHPALRGRLMAPIRTINGSGAATDGALGTLLAGVMVGAADDEGAGGVAPAARLLPIIGLGPGGLDEKAVAAGIRAAARSEARVLLVPLALEARSARIAGAVEEAARRGLIVVAPTGRGSEHQAAFPACLPGALAVAELSAEASEPHPQARIGLTTELLAPSRFRVILSGEDQAEAHGPSLAAAWACGVLALGLACDRSLSAEEGLRLAQGGPGLERPAGFYRRFRAVPLSAAAFVAEASQRRGRLILRQLWVSPPLARPGQAVEARLRLENVGRRTLSGAIEMRLPGNPPRRLDFTDLRPGRPQALRACFRAPAVPSSAPRRLRLPGGGMMRARPCRAEFLPVGLKGGVPWRAAAAFDFWIVEARDRFEAVEITELEEPRPGVFGLQALNTGNEPLKGLRARLLVDGRERQSLMLERLAVGESRPLRWRPIRLPSDDSAHRIDFKIEAGPADRRRCLAETALLRRRWPLTSPGTGAQTSTKCDSSGRQGPAIKPDK